MISYPGEIQALFYKLTTRNTWILHVLTDIIDFKNSTQNIYTQQIETK